MLRKYKYERKYNINCSEVGKAGEYRVASELLLRGHKIYLPCVDNGIDLIIDKDIKIQIKSGQKKPDYCKGKILHYSYIFNFHSSKYADRHVIKPKRLDGVDYVICWCIDDDEFYIIPAEKINGKRSICFTSDENKRTQVKWNRWRIYHNAWGLLKGEKIEEIQPTKEIECKQCGYKWIPLTLNPTRCPQCNGRWYQKMYDHTCKRCSHVFHSKIENPNWCPHCNSRVWNIEKTLNDRPEITCIQCGYKWQLLVDSPSRCPKCKTRKYSLIFNKKCKRCNFEWETTTQQPSKCPSCFSKEWYKEPQKELVTINK